MDTSTLVLPLMLVLPLPDNDKRKTACEAILGIQAVLLCCYPEEDISWSPETRSPMMLQLRNVITVAYLTRILSPLPASGSASSLNIITAIAPVNA